MTDLRRVLDQRSGEENLAEADQWYRRATKVSDQDVVARAMAAVAAMGRGGSSAVNAAFTATSAPADL